MLQVERMQEKLEVHQFGKIKRLLIAGSVAKTSSDLLLL